MIGVQLETASARFGSLVNPNRFQTDPSHGNPIDRFSSTEPLFVELSENVWATVNIAKKRFEQQITYLNKIRSEPTEDTTVDNDYVFRFDIMSLSYERAKDAFVDLTDEVHKSLMELSGSTLSIDLDLHNEE